jgi:vitellogenic carboxypeptidase-like protein
LRFHQGIFVIIGFSFTKNEIGYAKTMDDVVDGLYDVVKQFFKLFPDFAARDFYVTGESYAGK